MDAATCLAHLGRLPARARRDGARTLIYKKNRRPAGLREQINLLDALRDEPALTDFDRLYALIAGSHKVCEEVLVEDAHHWLDRLLDAEAQIRAMPIAYGLRRDRTHLVFSAQNVALNLDLLTGARHATRLGDWVMHEVETLNLRRMTPYLFNSTSNTVKAAGLVALARPEAVDRIHDLMRRLVSYSIEINNPVHWWVFSRFRAPSKLDEVEERAAFGSHCNTILRLRALEDATRAKDADARRAAFEKVADLCVAQATPAQKTALTEAARTVFGDRWTASAPGGGAAV
ncbi:hypothetical protein SAMN05444340_10444 [Citreimonas salinaria]|uniref:Uncharacterized protein n=2 Tax=Citreimonas salinaria TaxID=321339 RepID=A0A1H3HMT3_9RHOB|nr:hypothetical protein SAMN05444340_10444 [Citreimonas salinaria]